MAAAVATASATPTDDAGWESDGPSAPTSVSAQVGDWEAESSSRDLPTEAALRQSLADDDAERTAEDRFDLDEGDPKNAEEAVAQEEARRAKTGKADPAEAEAADEAKPEKGEKKAKPLEQRVEKEIDRLKRVRFERGQEERRIAALKAEVAELEAKRTAAAGTADAPPAPTERPSWGGEGGYDAQGKTFDDYVVDLERYLEAKTDRKHEDTKRAELAKLEAEEAERSQRAFVETVTTRMDAARAAHPDFDTVIAALDPIKTDEAPFLRDAITLHDQGGEIMYFLAQHVDDVVKPLLDLPLTYPMFDALRETSKPNDLLAYYAAHPTEVERIARLGPASALVALGRLVSTLEDAPAGSSPPARPVTKAVPPPAARVDGSRSVVGNARAADPDDPAGGWDES